MAAASSPPTTSSPSSNAARSRHHRRHRTDKEPLKVSSKSRSRMKKRHRRRHSSSSYGYTTSSASEDYSSSGSESHHSKRHRQSDRSKKHKDKGKSHSHRHHKEKAKEMDPNYFESYTSLLNNYSQLCGEGYEINSITEEENIIEANGPRKAQRTKNFSPNEDVCIVSAWLHTSKDAIHGSDQQPSRFWKRIYNEFVLNCNEGGRGEQGIKNRWREINAQCSKFVGCLNQINNRHQSGHTDHGKLAEARSLYAASNKQKAFKFEHCYDLLKHERKWLAIFETNKQTNASFRGVPIASEHNSESSANKDRLMGRKASKEQLKRKKGRTEGEGSSTMSINEQWEQMMAIEREKSTQRERVILLMSKPKITVMDQESKEMEIMSKDTSTMDARHVAYWNMKKEEIWRKYNI